MIRAWRFLNRFWKRPARIDKTAPRVRTIITTGKDKA